MKVKIFFDNVCPTINYELLRSFSTGSANVNLENCLQTGLGLFSDESNITIHKLFTEGALVEKQREELQLCQGCQEKALEMIKLHLYGY